MLLILSCPNAKKSGSVPSQTSFSWPFTYLDCPGFVLSASIRLLHHASHSLCFLCANAEYSNSVSSQASSNQLILSSSRISESTLGFVLSARFLLDPLQHELFSVLSLCLHSLRFHSPAQFLLSLQAQTPAFDLLLVGKGAEKVAQVWRPISM
jgi:hypothetical protein